MSYDFSFSKKTLIFALAGFLFVGIVLFVAGLLIGTSWKTVPNADADVAGKQHIAAPATQPPPAPPEPVLMADVSPPATAGPGDTNATSAAAPIVKQAHSDAAKLDNKTSQASIAAPPNDGELKIIQEADKSGSEAADMPAYSVQVGVFLTENESQQLVRQLQKKGYTPIVLAATDDEGRLWFSVRIGTYTNKLDAAKAALNIAEQEKLKAVVRPLSSL